MTSVLPTALPFSQGEVKSAKAVGYGAEIGDLWVRLAASPDNKLRYFTRDSLAQRQDIRGSTSETVLDIGYTWARTEMDGGEGLDWDPRQLSLDDSAAAGDVRRFWDSKNMDVSSPSAGQPYTTELSKRMDLTTIRTDVVDIGASSSHVFIAETTGIWWYTGWADAAPSSFAVPAGVKMFNVSSGDEVMLVDNNGSAWYRKPDGTDFAQVYVPDVPIQAVWFAKGRFVAFRKTAFVDDGELGELISDGTFVPFDTTGEYEITSVVGTGPSIVAACTDGTLRSYVPEQANQLDPSSVNIVIRGRTDMPKGEVASVLGTSGSVLTVLTVAVEENAGVTCRFYRAEALSSDYDYVVGDIQLQREWYDSGEVIDARANMTPSRDAIWFSITESDGVTYVWRFDLVTFGLSRHTEVFDGVGYATTLFDGKAAVLRDSDGALFLESENYQSSGYIISPNLTFGLNTDIAWIACVAEAFNLADAGAQVEVWRSNDPEAILDPDSPSWVLIRRLSNPSQSGDEIPMVGVVSRTLALQLKVYPSGVQTASPKITRLAVRGIPTHRDWIVHLPVNISDIVEVPGRMPYRVPGLGDDLHREVLSLTGQSVALTVLDPPLAFRGVVDNVEEPVEYISERGSVSVYAMVEFRGTRITATVPATGDAAIGVGLLGVTTLGIGQTTAMEA